MAWSGGNNKAWHLREGGEGARSPARAVSDLPKRRDDRKLTCSGQAQRESEACWSFSPVRNTLQRHWHVPGRKSVAGSYYSFYFLRRRKNFHPIVPLPPALSRASRGFRARVASLRERKGAKMGESCSSSLLFVIWVSVAMRSFAFWVLSVVEYDLPASKRLFHWVMSIAWEQLWPGAWGALSFATIALQLSGAACGDWEYYRLQRSHCL